MTKHAEQQRRYYRKNASSSKAKSVAWRHKHPRESKVYEIRSRCKIQGIPFNLTVEDMVGDTCPVFGTPLIWGGNGTKDNTASVDRLVPSLGYVKGNVRVISYRANRIKNDATLTELERVVAYVKGEL